jgi:RNA polymerase sigma factor (sigma-70 family)
MTANHAALLRRVAAEASDRELLARFAAARDGEAFAELVRRYGPAVFGVCLRVARQRQDAEDAFQAVFVILARRAGTLQRPDLLGNWLYGVAVRVARKARRSAGRRRLRETTVAVMPEPGREPLPPSDVGSVIDEELAALPEWYRDAVLLCDQYGHSRAEAAARLGVPEGTLSSRLAAGRKKLADRLARRGVTASVGTLVAVAVPPELASAAVDAALAGVTGTPLAAGIESLTHEGGHAMGKLVGWVAALAATVGIGVGAVLALSPPPDEPARPPAADADPQKQDKPAQKADAVPARAAIGKAKLLATAEFDNAFNGPVWSPDGDFLVVHQGHEIGFWNPNTTRKPATASLNRGMRFIGLSRNDREMVCYTNAGGRINAQTGLFTYSLHNPERSMPVRQELFEPRVASVTELEADDVVPVALVRRGKDVLAVKRDLKRNPKLDERPAKKGNNPFGGPGGRGAGSDRMMGGLPYNEPREVLDATRYRLIDATTGEVKPDIVKVPAQLGYDPYAVSHLHNQLYVAVHANTALAIEAYDLADGKRVWRKGIEPTAGTKNTPYQLVVSPEGRYLAVNYIRQPEGPPPEEPERANPFGQGGLRDREPAAANRAVLVILDLSTDGPDLGPKVPDFGTGSVELASVSHDARLLALHYSDGSRRSVQVWDTTTGKRLKSWTGSAALSFHPTKPLLAALEHVTEYADNKPVTKSVVGLWDFSEFVKP